MFIVLERGWARMGFHFHFFLKENIPRPILCDISEPQSAFANCQDIRWLRQLGEIAIKISWLSAKQMPIIVCFKSAERHGQKPTAGWIDRGCWKGREQRRKPVKFQKQDWYISIDGEGARDFSKTTYSLLQMNYSFIYRSKSLCMLGTTEYEKDLF